MDNMKKYVVAGIIALALAAYIVFTNSNIVPSSPALATGGDTTGTGGSGNDTSTTTSSGGTTSTSTGGTGTTAGAFKDGTYNGSVIDAFYGQMQAAAVISGGKITDIKFLKYPDDPGHTTQVSNMALPKLKQEAIAIQSAKVNIVSGATQTSEAFQKSLQVALAAAKS